MLLRSIICLSSIQSTDSASSAAPVLTAEKIYHVVVDQSPYLVESTSTITWTQSSSIYSPVPTTNLLFQLQPVMLTTYIFDTI
ncbi:hypothetical protein BDQ17DRAFT_1361203 [Cyathus striatus]|nr:hypothetical protein BDQ17DRAFT_1361203 [Cyathus striatus]